MDCLRVDYRHCAIADELKRLRIMCLLFMVKIERTKNSGVICGDNMIFRCFDAA